MKNDKNDTSLLLTDKISRNFIQLKAHIFVYKKSVKTLKQADYKVFLIWWTFQAIYDIIAKKEKGNEQCKNFLLKIIK